MHAITVVIADHDEAERKACEYLLRHEGGIWVLAQASGRDEILALVSQLQPRILLCGFAMAAAEGFSLLRKLDGQYPATRVILVNDLDLEEDQVMQALNLGAWGYLGHQAVGSQLSKAVYSVDEGQVWVPRRLLGRFLERMVN